MTYKKNQTNKKTNRKSKNKFFKCKTFSYKMNPYHQTKKTKKL